MFPLTINRSVMMMITVVALGCGSRPPQGPVLEILPVKGVVRIDGAPLSGVSVYFSPLGQTRGAGASAVTGPDGTYELKVAQSGATGCPSGEYKVLFSKFELPNGQPAPPNTSPTINGAREVLPVEYRSPVDSRFVVQVTRDTGGTFSFDLMRTPSPGV